MPMQQPSAHNTGSCSSPEYSPSMDPASPDGSGGSRVRQRLKPWLEAQINSGRFPGLQWVKKEEGLFRITWKHGGRADWSEQDALIFKEWAIHTGRYREGTDTTDWPTWKTRLRCALNKLPDIQEMKDMSCYDEPNPYRVYKFVDRRGSGSKSPSQQGTPLSVNEDSCGGISRPTTPMYHTQHRPTVIQANIPHVVNESLNPENSAQRQEEQCTEAQVNSLGSDLEQVSINDLVPMPVGENISLTNISVDSNINSGLEPMDTDSMKGAGAQYQQHNQQIKSEPVDVNPLYCQTEATDSNPLYCQREISEQLTLTLRYRTEVINHWNVSNPNGCRVYYSGSTVPMQSLNWDEMMFGPWDADQINVPFDPSKMNQRQHDLTYKLLEALELGVNIYVDKGSIYILRRCKTSVFTAPPNTERRQTIKVERHQQPVKIFDYHNDFLPALNRYQLGEGPRPSSHVIVAFGQHFRPEEELYQHLLFSVTVSHPCAEYLLARHVPESPPVEISHSNEYDQYMNYMRVQTQQLAVSQAVPVSAAQPMPIFHGNTTN